MPLKQKSKSKSKSQERNVPPPKNPLSTGIYSKAGGKGNQLQTRPEGHESLLEPKFNLEGMKFNLPEPSPAHENREDYVNYALDMLVHNLISSGQLDPSKGHLLKTEDMKAHIGRMADRVAKAKSEGIASQIATSRPKGTRWAIQPNSLPITIFTDKDPLIMSKPRSTKIRNNLVIKNVKKGSNAPFATATKLNSRHPPVPPHPGPPNTIVPHNRNVKKVEGSLPQAVKEKAKGRATMDHSALLRSVEKERLPMTIVPIIMDEEEGQGSSQGQGSSGSKKHGKVNDELKVRSKNKRNSEDANAHPLQDPPFRIKLDMKGFKNEEISIDLDGRRLTITGNRPKRDEVNARKATETIEIPGRVDVDNLKIARRMDGILIIEESASTIKA